MKKKNSNADMQVLSDRGESHIGWVNRPWMKEGKGKHKGEHTQNSKQGEAQGW